MTGRGNGGPSEETGIPGCSVLRHAVHEDARGRFAKPFATAASGPLAGPPAWAECFWSESQRGVVRGFHVQVPPAEHSKLLWVVSGISHSVVVDLRAGSPAFQKTAVVELDATRGKALYVPTGVAHGFQALEDNTIVVYLVTSAHAPAFDSGVRWDSAAVKWPIPVTDVSARDRALPTMESFVTPFRFGS